MVALRSGGRAVERRTLNRGDCGSIPPAAVSKIRQLKTGGPFYLVSMPGEVKYPICVRVNV